MKFKDKKCDFKIELLNQYHNLSSFDCGDDDLNEFLKKDAFIEQKKKLSLTHLIFYQGEVIGYFSLLTDKISVKNLKNREIKENIKTN